MEKDNLTQDEINKEKASILLSRRGVFEPKRHNFSSPYKYVLALRDYRDKLEYYKSEIEKGNMQLL